MDDGRRESWIVSRMRVRPCGSRIYLIPVYFFLLICFYYFVFGSLLTTFPQQLMKLKFDPDLLDGLDIDCQSLINGSTNSSLKLDSRSIEDRLLYSPNRCEKLKSLYRFPKIPLSQEEASYPLAYGMLVYKELPQVLFLLSSIYQPQNEYCLAVGENAGDLFKHLLGELASCFENVHFMKRPPIHWGSHEIINSAYGCLEFLSHLKTDWQYFQYLSGVDVPLKTNFEMVRIMKALNGSANVEFTTYQEGRLRGKNLTSAPLPLFKSSLSALVPRGAANEMASSLVPRELLKFLENTGIADEGFWGTLLGNKEKFDIPGSVNAHEWMETRKMKNELNLTSPGSANKYYISRDQVWIKNECGNYMTAGSCVFGLRDVPRLRKSKALVAHKLYLTSEPEAYFCLLRDVRRRSEAPDKNFDVTFYRELPQTELNQGRSLREVTHLDRIL